jgi:hypothetical protein
LMSPFYLKSQPPTRLRQSWRKTTRIYDVGVTNITMGKRVGDEPLLPEVALPIPSLQPDLDSIKLYN